ncbi:hypothetical protein M0R45_025974 [Rubus argutus]|uniref:Uncharacterized protein n=1 Tax=Rubus argutus TaxID=59490 RepID=A0AAW1WXU0_RUBAR
MTVDLSNGSGRFDGGEAAASVQRRWVWAHGDAGGERAAAASSAGRLGGAESTALIDGVGVVWLDVLRRRRGRIRWCRGDGQRRGAPVLVGSSRARDEETPVWIEVPRCVVVCGELRGCGQGSGDVSGWAPRLGRAWARNGKREQRRRRYWTGHREQMDESMVLWW